MAVFITTLVAAVVTALFGMLSYLYQKQTDRQVDLSKQQREAYTLYLTSYYDWLIAEKGSDEEAKERANCWRAYQALFPLASDGFLRAAMRFHAYTMAGAPDFTTEAGREKVNELWINL